MIINVEFGRLQEKVVALCLYFSGRKLQAKFLISMRRVFNFYIFTW